VRSSSLVCRLGIPRCAPECGTDQFKDVFLGLELRDYNSRRPAQKLRARGSGKHTIGKCGFPKRNHTHFSNRAISRLGPVGVARKISCHTSSVKHRLRLGVGDIP